MFSKSRQNRWWYAASVFGLLTMAGCGPGFAPAGISVVVRRPPPNRVEARPPAPGGGYIWIEGHQAWQGGDYVWVGGRWESPPRPKAHWVSGHWQHARGGWYWVEGHWR
ncbi:MAG TPA: hypothetical protein VGM77_05830 [Gemmatimonadales bacterium]|jgi:hypothetical protein